MEGLTPQEIQAIVEKYQQALEKKREYGKSPKMKEKHAQYYEQNKDHIKEIQKAYYTANREKILARQCKYNAQRRTTKRIQESGFLVE